jgi:hypothetical protein
MITWMRLLAQNELVEKVLMEYDPVLVGTSRFPEEEKVSNILPTTNLTWKSFFDIGCW